MRGHDKSCLMRGDPDPRVAPGPAAPLLALDGFVGFGGAQQTEGQKMRSLPLSYPVESLAPGTAQLRSLAEGQRSKQSHASGIKARHA